jgi:membrane protease subunit HflC
MKALTVLVIIVVLLAFFVFYNAAYTVDETEQVIITQWGRPVSDEPITEPGLKFKVPFIQHVNRFEKRLIEWDGDPEQIPTLDKKFIWVDSTARWRIKDALTFFTSVKDEIGAQGRIDDIIDGETRTIISSLNLIESVRTTNREFKDEEDQLMTRETDMSEFNVEVGRHEIGVMIRDRCAVQLEPFGIELVDVRLRRINYVPEVRRKVFDRMISERERMAEFYRSEGLGKKAEIDGRREKELRTISSEAYKTAEEVRGKADAESTRIYAESFGADPDFYAFLKKLESYKEALQGDVNLVISTDSEFFSLFNEVGDIEE